MWAALVILASCAVFAAVQGDDCLGTLSVGVDNVVVCPVNCSVANASVLWCLDPPQTTEICLDSKSGEQVEDTGSSLDVYVNEFGELIVRHIPQDQVVNTTCSYLLGSQSVCDEVTFQMTQNIGVLQFQPIPDVFQAIVNGRSSIGNQELTSYVGVTLAMCFTGSIFGYNGSPVFWTKDGELFSNSTFTQGEHKMCDEYLSYLESSPEYKLGQSVQSFVDIHKSNPCLQYNNRFIAILRIGSLKLSNKGKYVIHLESMKGLVLSNADVVLREVEYISIQPVVDPLPLPVIEIDEGSTNETVCRVNTSVGVEPVWLIPGGQKADLVNTTCRDAECFCVNDSPGVSYVLVTNEILEPFEGATISQHSLILFICNAEQSFNGSYTCLVENTTDGFAAVNKTLVLLVAPVESSNHALIVSVGVAAGLLFLMLLVILATVVGCLYIKAYFEKSREDRVVDLPIPGQLPPYCYDLIADNMEFPRDNLIQLELLGEGQFGQVFKAQASGIVPGDNTRNIVAVKTVKENALNMDVNDLYAELEIMKKMEPHPNILNLLGYCTRPFNDPPLIIMEFALHGSLKSFLRRYKQALFRLPSDASSQYSHSFTALSREHTPAPNSPVAMYPPHSTTPSIVLPTLVRPLERPVPLPVQSVTEYLEICGEEEETAFSCEEGHQCTCCDSHRDGGATAVRDHWNLYSNLPLGDSTVHRHHLALDEPAYYNQMDGSDYQYQYQYQYQYGYQSTPYYNLPGPHQLYYNQSHAHSSSAELGQGRTGAEGRRDSVQQQSPPATSVCSCDWEGEKVSFTTGPDTTDVQSGTQAEVDLPRPVSQKSVGAAAPGSSGGGGGLREVDFLNFALQISHGMEHLERMKCLHRDLAARNVLIAEGFLLKIADFGLARELTDKDYYRKRTSGKLPARWMAIESLSTERLHTHKSDVWSFGVLLWEICTYGSLPYGRGDVASTLESLLQHLLEDHRLPKPEHCSNDMYQIMRRCWIKDPSKRPSFSQLVLLFDHMLSTAHGYLQMSEEESMQARPSLERLMDQQRRRPSMDLIVEESHNANIVTTPLSTVHSKNTLPGRSTSSPSRDSNGGRSSSVHSTSDRALSSVANGNVVTGAIASSRTPPIPLTKNLQETTV